MIQSYTQNEYKEPVKRYVRTLQLRPDSKLIAEYRKRHQAGSIWPEIVRGIKSVGILEMEIYIAGTTLVMILDTPVDFDWDSSMERLGTLPRQQEWEDYMAEFQQAEEGMSPAAKWVPMERMFHLYDDSEL